MKLLSDLIFTSSIWCSMRQSFSKLAVPSTVKKKNKKIQRMLRQHSAVMFFRCVVAKRTVIHACQDHLRSKEMSAKTEKKKGKRERSSKAWEKESTRNKTQKPQKYLQPVKVNSCRIRSLYIKGLYCKTRNNFFGWWSKSFLTSPMLGLSALWALRRW